ncbi:hypothetical protein HAZT_HAZT001029 [Hyalella azteca]|uniref:Uncharacterized protein n=1 Tax=Hyalella azteca TaxID=294128 RepID=A0A6A0H5E8_HYAAZ|nr:hypothetical protein HAZT_HAZT001029 [Hyalella azteca]
MNMFENGSFLRRRKRFKIAKSEKEALEAGLQQLQQGRPLDMIDYTRLADPAPPTHRQAFTIENLASSDAKPQSSSLTMPTPIYPSGAHLAALSAQLGGVPQTDLPSTTPASIATAAFSNLLPKLDPVSFPPGSQMGFLYQDSIFRTCICHYDQDRSQRLSEDLSKPLLSPPT